MWKPLAGKGNWEQIRSRGYYFQLREFPEMPSWSCWGSRKVEVAEEKRKHQKTLSASKLKRESLLIWFLLPSFPFFVGASQVGFDSVVDFLDIFFWVQFLVFGGMEFAKNPDKDRERESLEFLFSFKTRTASDAAGQGLIEKRGKVFIWNIFGNFNDRGCVFYTFLCRPGVWNRVPPPLELSRQ